jgi:hypothetical protein
MRKRWAAAFGVWAILSSITATLLYQRSGTIVELGVLLATGKAVAVSVATLYIARQGFEGDVGQTLRTVIQGFRQAP